ncbi:MAG: hypothetical protein AAF585_28555 [Verrucomicrobiota bacterium]
MNPGCDPILLSLRPEYADLVFQGLKTAELRRRIGHVAENREVFIYVTSPVMAVRGSFRVGHVWKGDPDEVWAKVHQLAQVSRSVFDAYYNGKTVAYALEIRDVKEFSESVTLKSLRERFPKFVVPQSYRRLLPAERRCIVATAARAAA